jgi:hypothetical protein
MQLELTLKHPSNKISRITLQRGGDLTLRDEQELRAAVTLMRAFVTARLALKGEKHPLDFDIVSEVGMLYADDERIVCKLGKRGRAHESACLNAAHIFTDDRLTVEGAVARYLERDGRALGNVLGLSGQLFTVKRASNALRLRSCAAPRSFEAQPAHDLYQEVRQRLSTIRWDSAAVQAAGGFVAFIAPCAHEFVSGTYRNGKLEMTFDVGVASFPSNACDMRALNTLFEQVLCLKGHGDARSE